MDDATRSFITETINPALAASMESINRSFQERLERTITAMNNSVNAVCMRQDALAADVQRLNGETGTSNRPNNTRMSRIAKIEFPKFYGDDPAGCINLGINNSLRSMVKQLIDWNVYVEALLKRFSSCYEDPMSDLKNIRQKGGLVQVYIDAFDLIMTKVDVPESQAVNNNIVARKINKPLVSTKKPVNNSYVKNFGTQAQNIHYNPPRPNNAPYKKQLTQKELDDKRAKNQCFYYDQKYVPSHKCSGKLFSLDIVKENGGSEEEIGEQFEEGVFGFEDNSTANVIADQNVWVNTFQTMRVKGQINNKPVNILIDCGSTHNFLDLTTAKQMGCPGVTFQADFMLIPLGGCEMVLGVQWLSTLGDIVCNFLKLKMEFMYKGKKVALRGVPQPALQWMQGKQLGAKLFSMAVCVYPSHGIKAELMSTGINSELINIHPLLSPLMHKYDGVFAVLKSLPPHRKHDHRIPLQENTSPINIRPYRHPPIQKDAIEAMVTELLESRVIRESHSPFSSLIVMVKKKDETWRMCVDYRALNKKNVKDKFPIPIIEELIDELFGAKVFTKLDLRSGYHQIRKCEEDIHKTAFRTHQGHYEFLVMPFGLTNAPSSFQALMNEVFAPFLKKFVLVFFDDILVFSRDMEEHVKHLDLVQAMQDWPVPVNIKKLRGFIGLTGYYRKFIMNYATISRPLTDLLKKNSFEWSNTAQQAFDELKIAVMNAPVLALPNFLEEFIVETDASKEGIRAILQQQGHPISFLSRTLAPRHKGLSTYEKELWAVVYVMEK
ncbi:glycoside hydrolase, catalytic domain-containing protein [Tanacetum coccineum]|uniref:Glycoside hydrolase, catalytic domain-containing protein n=1 Tax=Tanacetum coccineum TaxID=301880 RepID=A0ABQ5ILR2_9ASTR